MQRIVSILRFGLTEFGPLIGFWVLAAAFGTKVAIAGAVVIIVVDAVWRMRRGHRFTRLYLLTSGLTLIFGGIDLVSETPFMLTYEAVITNTVTGIAFVLGAYGEKPMIQEIAEQREGQPFPERADIRRFFELFTLAWAAYFFVKALFYLWTSFSRAMSRRNSSSICGGMGQAFRRPKPGCGLRGRARRLLAGALASSS